VGDAVRHRGGRISAVQLISDGRAVEIEARLDPSAREMARDGSRFWIVRPHVGLRGVPATDLSKTISGAWKIRRIPPSSSRAA